MPDLSFSISERERREIMEIATIEGDRIGRNAPVSLEEMARALLQGHLVLIRDCGGILPGTGPKLKPDAAGKSPAKIKGKRDVSLSVGIATKGAL